MNREDEIQNLLRHAFGCLKHSKCNCKNRIQKFLQTDKTSLEWAKNKIKTEKESKWIPIEKW